MKIIIKIKNLDLTEAIENFINKKIGTLKKFDKIFQKKEEQGKTLSEVFIEIEKETKRHRHGNIFRVVLQAILHGKNLIAVSMDEDLLKAIVDARDELRREIKKHKLKFIEERLKKERRAKEILKS